MDDWTFATDEQLKADHASHVTCYIKWLFANSPLNMDMFSEVRFAEWRQIVDAHLLLAKLAADHAIRKAMG
jgi:hypothetical protein